MFVINWNWNGFTKNNYIVNLSSRVPYTKDIALAKRWKTFKNAERYLSLKDPTFASQCVIVERNWKFIMKLLYIVRGLPGSGKSTIAEKLATRVIEADNYFYGFNSGTDEVEYNFEPSKLGAAHKWCKDQVDYHMNFGDDIAVSNTFTQKWEAAPYIELAKKYGYVVQIITVQSNFENVHGVPQATIEKMKARWENFTLEDF